MAVLCIDTSTSVCSAALAHEGVLIGSYQSSCGQHAHDLPLFIEQLLQSAQAENLRIDAVALSEGPGSYTGLRIATATAKGLCYGLHIPLITINTLQVLCESLCQSGFNFQSDDLLCPMLDARRMEVYTALFDTELKSVTDTQAKIIDKSSFQDLLKEKRIIFFGDGAAKCKETIVAENAVFVDEISPLASSMVKLAEDKYKNADFADLAYFAPLYLKEFVATVSHKTEQVLYNNLR